jgi:hypothetical protein
VSIALSATNIGSFNEKNHQLGAESAQTAVQPFKSLTQLGAAALNQATVMDKE